MLGKRDWIALARAEAKLVLDDPAGCRIRLEPMTNPPEDTTPESLNPRSRISALLLEAESYLRENDLEEAKSALRKIDPKQSPADDDQIVLARLRLEIALYQGELGVAWKQLGVLHGLLEKSPWHLGFRRTFQISCARIHLAEGKYPEAHRRLQLAENVSIYPAARWEYQLQLGSLLEAEDREGEAMAVWQSLSQEAEGTYFGKIAQARLLRYRQAVPAMSPRPEILQPVTS